MYLPDHFAETRPEELHRVITQHPLGALVHQGPLGLDANHIPFLFDADRGPHGTLLAHVARANALWQEVTDGAPVLVIFRAANAYISPNWYPSKPETHRHVPTWNYQAVHVHGTVHIRHDEPFLRGVVGRLTHDHERRSEQPRPWKMTDAPRDYLQQMLRNIVGIEVRITRVEGKWKLGQNREARDREGAATGLEQRGDALTAEAMREAGRGRRANRE
jgi:transcriptional regulator